MILVTNVGFELGWKGLGLALGGFGTNGLGPGLDNKIVFIFYHSYSNSYSYQNLYEL